MAETFGELLRRHRRAAGFTQETLARRSGLSAQAVGALERGDRRFPQRPTVARLTEALGLTGDPRTVFATAGARPSRASPAVPSGRAGAPRQLPAAVGALAGRDADVSAVVEALSAPTGVAVVTGMAGLGKTVLVLAAGHLVAPRFPDGQIFVDLRGTGPGRPMTALEAIGRILRSLGLPPSQVPHELDEAAAVYRSRLAGRRLLLVLDDAYDSAQVTPLLPGYPGCSVAVTSRRMLTALPRTRHLPLGVLDESAALQMLAAAAGPARVHRETAAATEVVRLCGHLPLAVHIAGVRLAAHPGWPIRHLAARLARRPLTELESDGTGIRARFASGPDRPSARHFSLLGLLGGSDFSTAEAARLFELPMAETELVLDRLTYAHLVQAVAPGRYHVHPLLQAYAAELLPSG